MGLTTALGTIENRVTLRTKEGLTLAHSDVSPSRVTAPEATEGSEKITQGRSAPPCAPKMGFFEWLRRLFGNPNPPVYYTQCPTCGEKFNPPSRNRNCQSCASW